MQKEQASPKLLQSMVKTDVWPFSVMNCATEQAVKTVHMTYADYDKVIASVHGLYAQLPTQCDGLNCPQSDWAGCVLRLAAHDFMDEGGADGCLALDDADNKGLSDCLYKGSYGSALSDAYVNFCSWLSLADFVVIAGEAVMNVTRQNVLNEHPDRTPLDFRSSFKYGRTTSKSCPLSFGQMPDAERGCNAVEDTLLRTMGLNWNQTAALMGGHTIGEAKDSRSGYTGRWKEAVQSRKFDNGYYLSLLLKGWGPDVSVLGRVDRNQWKRVDLGEDTFRLGREIMLDSDMCLYFSSMDTDVPTRPLHAVTVSSRAAGCECAWTRPNEKHMPAIEKYNNGKMCGCDILFPAEAESLDPGHRGVVTLNTLNFTKQRALCCSMQHTDTFDADTDCHPFGPAADAINDYAEDEDLWLTAYSEAWSIAVTRGHSNLFSLGHYP